VTAREVLRMATTAGAEIIGLDCGVLEAGRPAALTVLDGDSHNLAGAAEPAEAVVRRASPMDVERVLL
jgi:guanine deaminase